MKKPEEQSASEDIQGKINLNFFISVAQRILGPIGQGQETVIIFLCAVM